MEIDAKFEILLASIYVDPEIRAAFLRAPVAYAKAAGLTQEQAHALAAIERKGLDLASRSFERKRAKRGITAGH